MLKIEENLFQFGLWDHEFNSGHYNIEAIKDRHKVEQFHKKWDSSTLCGTASKKFDRLEQ